MKARYNKCKPMAKLIIGLGNPGGEYENTYHNVGLLALKKIAGDAPFKSHKGLFRYATAGEAVLIEPLVFMNESGRAAKEALKKFKTSPGDLIVIHDESDVMIGKYKLSSGRNSAGHRGVQSIMDALHSKEFLRARIGIRPAQEAKLKKASEFVLAAIKPKDKKALEAVFAEVAAKING